MTYTCYAAIRKQLFAGLLLTAACIVSGVNARAQLVTGSVSPAFEVASIRPNRSGSDSSSTSWNPGRISVTNITLRSLVLYAYGIKSYQLSGGPRWVDTDRYDISAKAGEGTAPEQLRLMLHSLLAARFNLVIHRETRDLPVFALLIGRNGLKVKEADGSPRTSIVKGRLTGQMTMSSLADALTRLLDRPVVDMSGVKGRFDLTLEWAPDEGPSMVSADPEANPSAHDTVRPSLFTALQEQLGLNLAPQRQASAVVVIDQAERPSEN